MLYTYDQVQLSVVKVLNTKILNNSFKKIAENDTKIIPVNDYIPNIWEQKWFNDQGIAGYDKGYCVWKNTMTERDFLDSYGDSAYKYAKGNERLNPIFLSTWSDLPESKKQASREKDQYLNLISGWSEVSSGVEIVDGKITYPSIRIPYFQPLFDYGPIPNGKNPRIELFISTKDNNKDLLSCEDSWDKVVLSSYTEYNKYLRKQLQIMFDKHVKEYHFNGLSTEEEYNNILVTKDLSNFNVNDAYNVIKVKDHTSRINTEGYDQVVLTRREQFIKTINGKKYHLYKGFTLWNSGRLDHYGIVPLLEVKKDSSDYQDYIVSVELNWLYASNGTIRKAETYDYPEVSSQYGDEFQNLCYSRNNNSKEKVQEILSGNNFEIDKFTSYNVSLTPVIFDPINDISVVVDDYGVSSDVLKDFSIISSNSYPLKNNDQDSTYQILESHHYKNNSFCFTNPNINCPSNKLKVPFISYYIIGYKTNFIMSYDISEGYIIGIQDYYSYTGEKINLEFDVYTNNMTKLQPDKDYTWRIDPDDLVNFGKKTLIVEGKRPFTGSLTKDFYITLI